ncbi:MAG: hypothetical protein HYV63_04125 [Candidatus Schekmanbacteria bacterium]|nr:hypothetical protein [Candidatus Schekmanbacteria bacterium]
MRIMRGALLILIMAGAAVLAAPERAAAQPEPVLLNAELDTSGDIALSWSASEATDFAYYRIERAEAELVPLFGSGAAPWRASIVVAVAAALVFMALRRQRRRLAAAALTAGGLSCLAFAVLTAAAPATDAWRVTALVDIPDQQQLTYTDTSAADGTQYYYTVRVFDDSGGASDKSNRVGGKPSGVAVQTVPLAGQLVTDVDATVFAAGSKALITTSENDGTGKLAVLDMATGSLTTVGLAGNPVWGVDPAILADESRVLVATTGDGGAVLESFGLAELTQDQLWPLPQALVTDVDIAVDDAAQLAVVLTGSTNPPASATVIDLASGTAVSGALPGTLVANVDATAIGGGIFIAAVDQADSTSRLARFDRTATVLLDAALPGHLVPEVDAAWIPQIPALAVVTNAAGNDARLSLVNPADLTMTARDLPLAAHVGVDPQLTPDGGKLVVPTNQVDGDSAMATIVTMSAPAFATTEVPLLHNLVDNVDVTFTPNSLYALLPTRGEGSDSMLTGIDLTTGTAFPPVTLVGALRSAVDAISTPDGAMAVVLTDAASGQAILTAISLTSDDEWQLALPAALVRDIDPVYVRFTAPEGTGEALALLGTSDTAPLATILRGVPNDRVLGLTEAPGEMAYLSIVDLATLSTDDYLLPSGAIDGVDMASSGDVTGLDPDEDFAVVELDTPTPTPTETPTWWVDTPTETETPTETPTWWDESPTPTQTPQEPTSTATVTPTPLSILTGISSTFSVGTDGLVSMRVHVGQGVVGTETIYDDIEIYWAQQNPPVATEPQPPQPIAPDGWQAETLVDGDGKPIGIRFVKITGHLVVCSPVFFGIQFADDTFANQYFTLIMTSGGTPIGQITSTRVASINLTDEVSGTFAFDPADPNGELLVQLHVLTDKGFGSTGTTTGINDWHLDFAAQTPPLDPTLIGQVTINPLSSWPGTVENGGVTGVNRVSFSTDDPAHNLVVCTPVPFAINFPPGSLAEYQTLRIELTTHDQSGSRVVGHTFASKQ